MAIIQDPITSSSPVRVTPPPLHRRNLTSRDLALFAFGVIMTLLIGGWFSWQIAQEHAKYKVIWWLQAHAQALQPYTKGARLMTNTSQLGTIILSYDAGGLVDHTSQTREIANQLVLLQCPYAITWVR